MSGTADGPKNRDAPAGQYLKELREDLFITREDLPHAMRRAGVPPDQIPSLKTIYNVEERGQIPRTRLMFGFARFYGVGVRDIWSTTTQRRVAL